MTLLLHILLSTIFGCMLFEQSLLAMHASKPLKINIKLLKGTHDISPYAYAPFWGLAVIENGLAQQWYEFCPKQQNKSIISVINNASQDLIVDKALVLKILAEYKNTALQDLVLQMFHLAGGTFTITNALNNPVQQFTPFIIGKILRMVHDAKIYDEAFIKSVEEFLVTLKLKDPAGKDFKAKDFRPFAKALAISLQEFAQGDKAPDKTLNVVQSVLLGFMLCKSNTKSDLEAYFSGFEGKSVKLSDEMYDSLEFTKIMENEISEELLLNNSKFADYVCATIYQNKYASNLPKMATNKGVKYQDYEFTDCIETTMFNLANIVTFDALQKRLGLKLPEHLFMNPQLTLFYKDELNSNPGEVDHNTVHQNWVSLVENIAGAAYNRIGLSVIGMKHAYIQINELYKKTIAGAIPVASFDPQLPVQEILINNQSYQCNVVNIGTEKYLLIPQSYNLICFELMPTVSNIVVIMNHLFDLKLINTIDDIFQPDFAFQQFKNLCEKFSWKIDDTELQKIKNDQKTMTLDVKTKDQDLFQIHMLHQAHGYVSIQNDAQSARYSLDAFYDWKKLAVCLSMGTVRNEDYGTIYEAGLYLYDPILNIDQRANIIKKHLDLMVELYMEYSDTYIAELIMSMANSEDNHYHDFYIHERVSINIVKAMFVMSFLVCIKYNNPTVLIQNLHIFLNKKILNKDQVVFLIEKILELNYDHLIYLSLWEYLEKYHQQFDIELLIKWIDQGIINNKASFKVWGLTNKILSKDQIIFLIEKILKLNDGDSIYPNLWRYLEESYQQFDKELLMKWIDQGIVSDKASYGAWDLAKIILNEHQLWQKIATSLKNRQNVLNIIWISAWLFLVELIQQGHIFKDPEQIDQIILWSDMYEDSISGKKMLNLIDNLVNNSPVSATHLLKIINLMKKHEEEWASTEELKVAFIDLQDKLLKKIPKNQTNQQPMMDFARNGTGALHATTPKLMRYDSVTEQMKYQKMIEGQIQAQQAQLERIYRQQEATTTNIENDSTFYQMKQQPLPKTLPLQTPSLQKPPLSMPKVSSLKRAAMRAIK